MARDEWITTAEAAQLLGVTTARIRQLIAEEKLSAQKLGGKYRGQWMVNASEVESLYKAKERGGTMKVKNRMTHSPITATVKTNYNQALQLMKDNGVHHLPIVDQQGKLIGVVTHQDMLQAQPSRVTTLSIYEMATLLETVTMAQIMSKPVYAVEEHCSISNAARFMLDHDIGCLPVMRDDALVGIITDTDIFQTFVEITGGGESGARVEARLPNKMGQLSQFISAFTRAGSWIVSVALSYDESGDYFYIDMKERGVDESKLNANLSEIGTVEMVDFRANDEDSLLTYS